MGDARVIVCEKTGRWAMSLRRVLSDLQDRIRETRSLVEMLREVESSPSGVVAIELSAERFDTQLYSLIELARRFHRTRTVVLTERGMERYELPVREAGAVHFVCSPRELLALGRMIRRHLTIGSPVPPPGVQQAIWDRLPWGVE